MVESVKHHQLKQIQVTRCVEFLCSAEFSPSKIGKNRVAVGDVLEEISAHGVKKGDIAFMELAVFFLAGWSTEKVLQNHKPGCYHM